MNVGCIGSVEMKPAIDKIEINRQFYEITESIDADIPDIRKLVNRSYQQLADMGLNSTAATHPDAPKRAAC